MKKPVPFGKYLLLERVNVGGMAEVFKAKAFGVEGFERMVAVKRILPNIAEDAEFITMFIDEAKISVRLNHANIAQVFDLGKQSDSYYIALEYIAGRDLRALFDRARTRGEPLPIPMACYVIMKMCEGLDYAHNKRDETGRDVALVHRDVSPQNILVSYDGEVKIIDFGIAKAANKASQTQAGIVKGKFGYMSPEQVQGFEIDRRSDVFAIGIVLYELLTSERLFVGESDFSTIEKIRMAQVTPPTRFNARIPAELERIVLRALAKDLDQRYQTAMDLHDDLQAFMYSSGSFFARKDLSAFMRRAFAEEIAKETARDEVYRKLDLKEIEASVITALPQAAGAATKPAGASNTSGGNGVNQPPKQPPGSAGNPGPLAPPPAPARASLPQPPPPAPPAKPTQVGSGLDWDDDELATRVYDRGDMDSIPPPAAPAPAVPPIAPAGRVTAPGVGGPAPRASSPGSLAAPPAPRASAPLLAPPPAPRPQSSGGLKAPAAPSMRAGAPSPFESPLSPPVAPTPSVPPPLALPTEVPPRPGDRTTVVVDRGSSMSSGTMIGGGLFLLAALLGVAWFFLRPKDPGTLQFATDPPDVVVVFDGQAVQASSSPFSITADPDSPHLLEVNKVGFRTYSTRVTLRPGEQRTLPTIMLQSTGDASTRNVQVAFASDPTGADVVLVRGRERLVLGTTPVNEPVNVAGEPWTVEMSLEGYETWRGGLTVPEGHSTMALSATLRQRTAANEPRPNNTATPAANTTGMTATVVTPPPAMTETTPPPAMTENTPPAMTETTPAATGPGTLRVNTTPWSQVSVDGRAVGNTPQMNIQLSPGAHRVTMINPDFNIRENRTVVITSGQATTLIIRLQAATTTTPTPTP